MFYNISEQINIIMMSISKIIKKNIFGGYSKAKHFPRQTRRSSHVWLQKLVNLEFNLSSVSEKTF